MANGGIIGVSNKTSFGKCTVTIKTSSGCVSLQSGTKIIKTAVVAGGGGGGGANTYGCGGSGGGGRGGTYPTAASAGTVNTGGGGGGRGDGSPLGAGGGSGIVIVRGPSAITFAVSPCTNSTGTSGSCKTATFTVSGTLTIS